MHSQRNNRRNAVVKERNVYSKKFSGTDGENNVPGNLCIIWKLNKAWPKGLGHVLTVLKASENSKRTPSLLYDF